VKGLKPILISAIAIGLLAGSVVGVAAQDDEVDPMAPSAFSGAVEGDGTEEYSTDPDTGLDRMVIPSFELADSRASGTWTQLEDFARIEDGGGDYIAEGESVRLANEGGAWVGTTRVVVAVAPNGDATSGVFTELAGEGGYEGLSLFMFETVGSEGELVSNAFIVPTDMVPAMPPAPAAE
jgi:hypothetical protein